MNPPQHLQGLFDGDPRYEHEYHQDYREPFWVRLVDVRLLLPSILALGAFIYHILQVFDYDLLPLPELLWNVLVYLTPCRLLNYIEAQQDPLQIKKSELAGLRKSHAAKSEVMRRILGMDAPGGIISTVTQAGRRRLSSLPGIAMTTQSNESQPPGLGNWDNSCYQNSVLQGLASLGTLPNYLQRPRSSKERDEEQETDMKMAEALQDLIETLNDTSNNGRRIWTPAALKSMSSWQQQDAQEYFSKVLDEIDKEIGQAADSVKASPGFESKDALKLIKQDSISSDRVLRNPLEGLIAQRVGCTRCGYSEGLSMIPFNCLTVPLGRAWEHDVSQCLDEYTKLEPIEGVECGKCTLLKFQRLLSTMLERLEDNEGNATLRETTTKRLEAVNTALEDDDYEEKTLLQKCNIPSKSRVSSTKSRQAVIARPPKSLVIHFNRSVFDENTGELRKNYSEVRFPKVLDLGPWCLGSAGVSTDPKGEEWVLDPDQSMIASNKAASRIRGPLYGLRAVVTHYGRHENGHYICYKKHPTSFVDGKGYVNEQWWSLSDDDVIKASEEKVLGQGGVFMLFYDCIDLAMVQTAPDQVVNETSVQDPTSTQAVTAAQVPLPTDDTEFSAIEEPEDFALTSVMDRDEESVTTGTSDNEDEDVGEREQQNYKPAKAIVVQPYVASKGSHNEQDNNGQQEMLSPGSLVMV